MWDRVGSGHAACATVSLQIQKHASRYSFCMALYVVVPPCMTARLKMVECMSGCSGMPLLKPCKAIALVSSAQCLWHPLQIGLANERPC